MLKKIIKKRETPFASGAETTIFTLAGQTLGFIKSILIAVFFGASAKTDVYFAAETLIQTPTGLLADAINALAIPKFQKEARKDFYLRSVLCAMLLLFLVVLGIFIIFGREIATIVFKGFSKDKIVLLDKAMLFMIPLVVLSPMVGFLDSVLRAQKYLIFGNLGRLLGSILALITLILTIKLGIYGLVLSTVMGILTTFVILLTAVNKRHTLVGDFNLRHGIVQLKDSVPLMIGGSFGILSTFFDRFFASFLPDGTITIMNMSLSLNSVVRALFVSTLISAFYPFISEAIVTSDEDNFNRYLSQVRKLTFGFFGLLSIALIPMSYPVLRIVYGHGRFDLKSVEEMSALFVIFASLFLTSALTNILVQIFYSLGKTKEITITSVFWILAGIGMNFLLVKYLGVKGLALTTAVVSLLYTLTAAILLQRRMGRMILNQKDLLVLILVTLVHVVLGFIKWNFLSLFLPLLYYFIVSKPLYKINIQGYIKMVVKKLR